MKFLFDQNISHRILELLPANYFGSSSVKKEGLIFPNHGSQEVGKGLEMKIRKDAGL